MAREVKKIESKKPKIPRPPNVPPPAKLAPVKKEDPWGSERMKDLLKYETIIASLGLTNFEEAKYSNGTNTKFKDGIGDHRVSSGYLENQGCMEAFRNSLKDNCPEL